MENFKFNVFSIFLKMNEILVCFFLLLFCRKCMEKITSWINSSFLYISLCSLFISFLNLFVEIYTYFLNTAYCFRSYPIMNKICTHFSSYWFVFIYIQNELQTFIYPKINTCYHGLFIYFFENLIIVIFISYCSYNLRSVQNGR